MAHDPSLRDVQRWMKAQIQPGGVAVGSAAGPVVLNAQRGTPGTARLSVYAGGYVTRMHEALAEVFEAVHHVLGRRAFFELAEAYARHTPSCEYNLSFAGRHLPTFLTAWPLTQELPFLPDLAQLEWRVCQAFHAVEQPPLDPSRLARHSLQDWERTRLVFQPSVAVVASSWPILDLWKARAQPRDTIDLDLVDRPQHVHVFRASLAVRCEGLDPIQSALLRALLDGQTLGAACAALAVEDGQPSRAITEWFARWARAGLLIGCDLAN